MNLKTFEGPYLKDEKSTKKVMHHLLIALLPIILFSVYKNGYIPYQKGYTDLINLFFPLIFILIAMITAFLTELIYYKIKKENKLKDSFPIITGLFVALVLPINTPIFILMFGVIVAIIVGKLIFGGFGHNLFNPALIGVMFVVALFSVNIVNNGGYLNLYEIDTIASATPLSHQLTEIGSYDQLVKPYGSLFNFFFGTIPGSVGETSALLILLAFCYLTWKRVIKWRIPVVYITTVFIITFLIANINNVGPWYAFFHILSGGLLFGAVFMATDPVTSPVTIIGQVLFGLFLGILTVLFRFLSPYPEGVLTSILTMNLFVFILDKIGNKARFNFSHATVSFIVSWILIVGVSFVVAASFTTEKKDESFQIINKEVSEKTTIYLVEQRGFAGMIRAEITIEDEKIILIKVISHNESYYQKIEDENFIEKLIEDDSVDAITGATITSNSLKNMVKNVWEDFYESKN